MFKGCSQFNQSLTSWNVSNVTDHRNIFDGAIAMEEANKPENFRGPIVIVPQKYNVKENLPENFETEECPICQENLANPVASPNCCEHLYHEKCIKEWMSGHNDCPLCRCVSIARGGKRRRFKKNRKTNKRITKKRMRNKRMTKKRKINKIKNK